MEGVVNEGGKAKDFAMRFNKLDPETVDKIILFYGLCHKNIKFKTAVVVLQMLLNSRNKKIYHRWSLCDGCLFIFLS